MWYTYGEMVFRLNAVHFIFRIEEERSEYETPFTVYMCRMYILLRIPVCMQSGAANLRTTYPV